MRKSIYIVEDNHDIGYILQYFLSEEGFEAELFDTVAALNIGLGSKIPDLFLLDVMLPDGNGLEVCNRIKQDAKMKHKPVLIMSAHLKVDDEKLVAAADEFIAKPFDLFKILDRVKLFLHAA